MAINDGRVVTNFIRQALSNKPITIYGTGNQTRSFCFVSDMINGLVSLFFSTDLHGPINLGNPQPISILELARKIISLSNSESEIRFLPLPLDDPKDREPDISKASAYLDWVPLISLDEGLTSTIQDISTLLLE
jgi:UDP-glucuronate decarboxylase